LVGIGEKDGIGFSKVMGSVKLSNLEVVGEFGTGFANFFPLLVFFFAFISFFNLIQRILNIFGIKQFIFNQSTLGSDENINDGKEILGRIRRDRTRKAKLEERQESKEDEKKSKEKEKKNEKNNKNVELSDLSTFIGKKNFKIDINDDDDDDDDENDDSLKSE
jgi:hypothetical protein